MYSDQSREYRLVIVSRSVETFGVGAVGKRNFGIGGGWAKLLLEMSTATKIQKVWCGYKLRKGYKNVQRSVKRIQVSNSV